MPNIIDKPDNNVKLEALKIAFLGTPDFAVPTLEKLCQSEFKPATVFCAPDKPVGRKQILTPPPIKVIAQKYNMPIYQPEDALSIKNKASGLNLDLIICVAYGLILPKEVLDAPRYGCLNIHPSLLPKYRGPSPIQATILNGDEKTGVTIMKMDEKIDHGPIVKNQKINIKNQEHTTPELSQILAEAGADLLLNVLPDWLAGKIKPQPQDESLATYTKIIKKEDGLIDWQKSAVEIERQIRAYQPWPGIYTKLNPPTGGKNQILKIIEADILETGTEHKFGEILLTNNGLGVQTGRGQLFIKKLQPEGGKPMSAQDFLRGHQDLIGQILN